MFWVQAILSFAVWIGLGVMLARLQPELQGSISKLSRNVQIGAGASLMVVCLAFLFVPLDILLGQGSFQHGQMSMPVWIIVTVCGLLFVGANTVALGFLTTVIRDAG